MLVCPHCRSENREEASACASCGRTLSPDDVSLRAPAMRTEYVEPELEMPAPKRVNPLIPIVFLAIIAAGVTTLAFWLAVRPDVCAGKFQSAFYEYCADLPDGWVAGSQLDPSIPGGRVDILASQAGPYAIVRSQSVSPTANTDTYGQIFYIRDELSSPSPLYPIAVGGVPALAWDVQRQTESGQVIPNREVAFVHLGKGWRITLQAPTAAQVVSEETREAPRRPVSFSEAVVELQQIFAMWVWR